MVRLAISRPGDAHEREADALAARALDSSRSRPRSSPTDADGGNLDSDTRSFMEGRLGADFGRIRVHADPAAARSSAALSADAFSLGRDVYFAAGRYAPGSDRGRRLLAHELAHTIQQGQSPLVRPAHQGVTGLVDRPDETMRIATPAPPMIQRSATWKGAAVHETVSLVDVALGGTLPATWAMLNGRLLKGQTDAHAAIKAPTVTTSGSGKAWTAKVDSVPAQEGRADETVLARARGRRR